MLLSAKSFVIFSLYFLALTISWLWARFLFFIFFSLCLACSFLPYSILLSEVQRVYPNLCTFIAKKFSFGVLLIVLTNFFSFLTGAPLPKLYHTIVLEKDALIAFPNVSSVGLKLDSQPAHSPTLVRRRQSFSGYISKSAEDACPCTRLDGHSLNLPHSPKIMPQVRHNFNSTFISPSRELNEQRVTPSFIVHNRGLYYDKITAAYLNAPYVLFPSAFYF